MHESLSRLIAVAMIVVGLAAQDPTRASKRESELAAEATATLHELADAYEAQRQHGRALALRKEILLEYAENDEKARIAVGFVKVGELWQPDPNRIVIEKDLTGEKKELRKIDKRYERFRKTQLRDHREVAELWTKAGNTQRASHHWRRVLAIDPEDEEAVAALSLARFAGFRGNAEELHMLRRAWAIRGAVEWLHRLEIPVTKLVDRTYPLLAKAEILHEGYRTENFEVWGTLPGDQMPKVAQHCERALLMCRTIFGTCEGRVFEPRPRRGIVFVGDQATYHQVLDQCADQFEPERLQFLKNDVDLAFLTVGERQVRFIKTNGSYDEAFDQAVRGVMQDVIDCRTEGLWEGIGHAGCGLLFGKTITFLLEQRDARTVASWAQQMLVPDIKVWMEIAAKSAWSKSDTRTSELVLLSAARFTTEQRVKAWSMCDYLFHRQPELLWQLNACKTEEIATPPEVEAEFMRRTGLALPKLDLEWRAFWSRQEELRRAMLADPLGPADDRHRERREQARGMVDAVNALRAAGRIGPLGFYYAEDVDVLAALSYADRLVKAEREQRRKPKKEIPLPAVPAAVGRSVLFSRAGEAADAVVAWWGNPAWRDAMLHPGRGLLGANENGNGKVLDLTEPVRPTTSGPPRCWPRARQPDVPSRVRLRDLGPRAAAALAASGKGPDDAVAMPLTLHFWRRMPAADLAEIEVRVYYAGARAEGVLVCYQGDEPGDSADGCLAWLGIEPPPAGAEVDVKWRLPERLVPEGESTAIPIYFRAN